VGYEGGLEWTSGSHWAASAAVFQRREHDVIDYVRANPASVWQAVNIEDINFTGFEGVIRARLGSAQSVALAYTGLYGAQQSLGGLQSQYVFNYPINQATANWLGSLPHGIAFRMRAGMTQRYHTDPYPLIEMALTRDFHWVQPYAQITNLTNTGYEEIQGVRMPGRAYLVGVQVRLSRASQAQRSAARN
jgi:iron complex outermembrane receptor protein